jgi:catechol 2,3-dioxygenase
MNVQPVATTTSIHPDTQIGVVSLTVASLERSIAFYEQVLGFRTLSRVENSAALGAAGEPAFLLLTEVPGAPPKPIRATGLYHFAILVPSRADLGRSLKHLVESEYRLDGYSDHLVSEALYLSDPDGNGIEIYRDRARDEWEWQNGHVVMASEMPDLRGILAEGERDPRPWMGLSEGTRIGHIHLQVADIPQAAQFYHNVLGFDIVAELPSALFVSAGGYHHHIGLNTWNSLRSGPTPAESAGLRYFSITFLDVEARQQVLARLEAAHIPFEQHGEAVTVNDLWDNVIHLTIVSEKAS